VRFVHISRTLRTSYVWRHVSQYVKKLQFPNQQNFTNSETLYTGIDYIQFGAFWSFHGKLLKLHFIDINRLTSYTVMMA
jgi:hypothetical protein